MRVRLLLGLMTMEMGGDELTGDKGGQGDREG